MKKIIKLRDMTKEQWERFKKNDCYNNIMTCENCPLKYVNCSYSDGDKELWINNKDLYSDKLLDYEVEIEENILNEKEKEYLKAVIKPFRDRVINIRKCVETFDKKLYFRIEIKLKSKVGIIGYEFISLPYFKNIMYKYMPPYHDYTLEDLGL